MCGGYFSRVAGMLQLATAILVLALAAIGVMTAAGLLWEAVLIGATTAAALSLLVWRYTSDLRQLGAGIDRALAEQGAVAQWQQEPDDPASPAAVLHCLCRALQKEREASNVVPLPTLEAGKKTVAAPPDAEEAARQIAEEKQALHTAVQAPAASLHTHLASAEKEAKQMQDRLLQAHRHTDGLQAQITQSSQAFEVVATTAETLAGSIREIAQQVSSSASVAQGAVDDARNADATVKRLSQTADEIGNILQLINAIAGQINLLALNATIEAARAGEAGKGFAVVASEVKNLAGQTTKATEQIKGQIDAIQETTRETVEVIGKVGGTIDEINSIASSITEAVNQQDSAIGDIAGHVQGTVQDSQQAAQAVKTLATDLQQASEMASEISGHAQAAMADSRKIADTLSSPAVSSRRAA